MIPSCAGFILFTQDLQKVVLIKTHRNVYGFPKGKRDKGKVPSDSRKKVKMNENPLVAAYREATEETGISKEEITQIGDLFVDELSFKGNPATRLYIGLVNENQVVLDPIDKDEIAEVKFVDLVTARTILIEKRQLVLNEALDKLKSL